MRSSRQLPFAQSGSGTSGPFHRRLADGDRQARGYGLERLLRDLFALWDLDPRAAFRTAGEQVDGAFSFEGVDYLLEARWREAPADLADLDAFEGKVTRKLDNTLGLFISINGYSEAARTRSGARPQIILMDGEDPPGRARGADRPPRAPAPQAPPRRAHRRGVPPRVKPCKRARPRPRRSRLR